MRDRSSFILAILLIFAIGGLGASPSSVVANGNNGDVKIHEADTEVEPIEANEPKVCTFHVHGLNFDASQGMDWWVDQQPPTGNDNAIPSRPVTADASGAWATEVFSLPNGHYKLYWHIADGSVKHKVFKVECAAATGAIAVTKYNDENGNGSQDPSEGRLEGWTFAVLTAAGATAGTITTGTFGSGTLYDLTPGEYTVSETLQSGWTNTDPGGVHAVKTTEVLAGHTVSLAFGNQEDPLDPTTGTLVITKYNDTNGNGARDEHEALMPGWAFGVEGGAARHGTTDEHGTLAFSDLPAGDYTVSETLQTGWTNTDPGGFHAVKTTEVFAGHTVSLAFGNHEDPPEPTTGAIGVTKYNDHNRNGMQDQGEALLAGWSFSVLNSAGASAGSITTGASGSGTLSGLAPGDYSVVETQQTNWHNSDPAGGTLTKTTTVVAGQTAPLAFGNYYDPPPPPPPSNVGRLTVVKYNDVDRDGARDQGEAGMAGWSFTVKSGDAIVRVLSTGPDGTDTTTLSDGTYTVFETQQSSWTSTDPGGTTPSKSVQIGPGSAMVLLFGNAQVFIPSTTQTALTIVKYGDANMSGARDSDEIGLADFTFLIRDESGALVSTATTDSSGAAVVTNLPLGAYTIVEQARLGWFNTEPGGAATRSAVFTAEVTTATVIFGNARVMLPSTATDGGATGAWVLVILGLALLTMLGLRASRYPMR